MGEFDLIDLISRAADQVEGDHGRFPAFGKIILGIGDDAAILEVPSGKQLVVSCDTLNEGIHFLPGTDARALGHKALAVNLSDLAAMGADPVWYLLALSLPDQETQWLEEFIKGMLALADSNNVSLIGGDTTSGPLSITITAMGLVDSGQSLRRGTAQPGESIVVSGTPGLAAFALDCLRCGTQPSSTARDALEQPVPRVKLGAQLNDIASSCIDVSDGLLADLAHLLGDSDVGALVNVDSLPVHPDMTELEPAKRRSLALTGGDDYELLFTLPDKFLPSLDNIAARTGIALNVIGRTTAAAELRCMTADGEEWTAAIAGYDHFPDSGVQ